MLGKRAELTSHKNLVSLLQMESNLGLQPSAAPALWFAMKLRAAGVRVFLYEFSWDGWSPNATWPVPAHGGECGYTWQVKQPPEVIVPEDDKRVSDVVTA